MNGYEFVHFHPENNAIDRMIITPADYKLDFLPPEVQLLFPALKGRLLLVLHLSSFVKDISNDLYDDNQQQNMDIRSLLLEFARYIFVNNSVFSASLKHKYYSAATDTSLISILSSISAGTQQLAAHALDLLSYFEGTEDELFDHYNSDDIYNALVEIKRATQFVVSKFNNITIKRLPKELILFTDGGQGVRVDEVLVQQTRLLFAMCFEINSIDAVLSASMYHLFVYCVFINSDL